VERARPGRPSGLAQAVSGGGAARGGGRSSRPAVSRQLKLLRENGLVERRRSFVDRRSLLYQIPPGQLRVIASWLAGTSVGRPLEPEFDERGLPRLG